MKDSGLGLHDSGSQVLAARSGDLIEACFFVHIESFLLIFCRRLSDDVTVLINSGLVAGIDGPVKMSDNPTVFGN